jgi:hypothetical protein
MVRTLLLRGMLAGLLGGLVAFGIAKTVGEPQVDKAIAFEEYVEARADHASHEADHHDELVSRSQQNFAGLGTGTLIYGAAMGGIFGLVFAIAYGRLGTMTARGTAAVLGLLGIVAGLAYLAVVVVAYLVLPGVNEVPQALLRGVVPANGDGGVTFPAVVLWRFRVAAAAVQVGLWATVAIAFGYLSQRALEGASARPSAGAMSGA